MRVFSFKFLVLSLGIRLLTSAATSQGATVVGQIEHGQGYSPLVGFELRGGRSARGRTRCWVRGGN
jgi:hypothetical protein